MIKFIVIFTVVFLNVSVVSAEIIPYVVFKGAFKQPGKYSLQAGDTLSSVIKRAGGLSSTAYPLGAVVTRLSEKIRQIESHNNKINILSNLIENLPEEQGNLKSRLKLFVNIGVKYQPIGRIYVDADPDVLQMKPEKDFLLMSGDTVFMPNRSYLVNVRSDVLMSSAYQYKPDLNVNDYIALAGSHQKVSNPDDVFIIYPNGLLHQPSLSYWNYQPYKIPPGSTVVIPKSYDSMNVPENIQPLLSGMMNNLIIHQHNAMVY